MKVGSKFVGFLAGLFVAMVALVASVVGAAFYLAELWARHQ